MILHFRTPDGEFINVYTEPEGYNFDKTEYTPIEITYAGRERLLRILDFNCVPYNGEPIDPPPFS